MNKYITNIVLAIILVIIPALGFPITYIKFFVVVLGLVIASISVVIYRQEIAKRPQSKSTSAESTFVDNLTEKV